MVDTYDALLQFEDEYATKLLLSLLVFDNSEYRPNDEQSSHRYKASLKRRINLAIGDMGQEKCTGGQASVSKTTSETQTPTVRANHHPAADRFLEELFRAPSLTLPASPTRSPTSPIPSLSPTLGTIVGLDHLHNLVKLMEQLIQLKQENTTLKRRCTYLEDTRSLLLVQTQALAKKASQRKKSRGRTQACPKCRSQMLMVPSHTLPDNRYGGMAARSSFHQRSASVGSIDMVGISDHETWMSSFPKLLKSMDPRKVKSSKFSKWERVKKVFIGKPGPVHKSEVGAVSARQLLQGQSKHVLHKVHTLSEIEGTRTPLFSQDPVRRVDELGQDIRVTFEYYPSPFESQGQTLSASPQEKYLRADHNIGSLTTESSSGSSGEESDIEGEPLLAKRSASLVVVTPPRTYHAAESKRKLSNISQRHASSPDVKIPRSSMEEITSPDKDQKKHHRTAWGRVKDIIQTRKNSLKRRGTRNKVEDIFDKSSASLESSENVFSGRSVSPLPEMDIANEDQSINIANRGIQAALLPTRSKRNIKDGTPLSESERGTAEKEAVQIATPRSEITCASLKDNETITKGTDIRGSESGPHRRTSGASKAILKRTAAVETRDNSQQTDMPYEIRSQVRASLCEKAIQTSPFLSHKSVDVGHAKQTVSQSKSDVSVDRISNTEAESDIIEGDICVSYTISHLSDDPQATVISKSESESSTTETTMEVSETFVCEGENVSVEATCTIGRSESQKSTNSKSSVFSVEEATSQSIVSSIGKETFESVLSNVGKESQRPRLERQKETAQSGDSLTSMEEPQEFKSARLSYPPHSPIIRSKYPRRMRHEAKAPSTAGIQDWQGTPPRRQLRHRRVSSGSPKYVHVSHLESQNTDALNESANAEDPGRIPQSPGRKRQSLQPVSLAGPLKTADELMHESETIRGRARAASCPADPRLKHKSKTDRETTNSPQPSDEVSNKKKPVVSMSQSDVAKGHGLVKNASFLHDEFPLPEPRTVHTLPKKSSEYYESQKSVASMASLERKSSGDSTGNNSKPQGTSKGQRSKSPMPTVAALLKHTLTLDVDRRSEYSESKSADETILAVTAADGETTARRKTIKTRLQEKAWFSKSKRTLSKTSK